MLSLGETAPDFTAPVADGEISTFSLSDRLDEAPLVLAFFPGAFTSVCTNEMTRFQTDLAEYNQIGGTIYGISVDTPFALNEFRDKHGIDFGIISDMEQSIIEAYDVRTSFEELGVHGLAKRAVFVIDENQEITYEWVSEDPGVEPDYEAVQAAVSQAA